uniref:Uncharacterized protein n=1 Tax=Candidatus Kentrum sp. UNK TaxID=2126344 RepID=A0A451AR55_9GAMM|nr:MAG: hypothetical protein BECKUNK1418G_GA0071005_100432 [Candidatus Kentron sp. UNK]VFK68519.1 MAG: hypothetical protein BECKUNK1418H_GA0071006_100334 [Candidatus Kentron sp. UNK]
MARNIVVRSNSNWIYPPKSKVYLDLEHLAFDWKRMTECVLAIRSVMRNFFISRASSQVCQVLLRYLENFRQNDQKI